MGIGEKISHLIDNKGFTKRKVCQTLQITEDGFYKKMRKNYFTVKEIQVLAKLFEVSETYFFEKEEEPTELTNDVKSKIGEKILDLAQKKGFTKKKVYTTLGISQQGFDEKLRRNFFNTHEIKVLSELFEVAEAYFFDGQSNVELVESTNKKVRVPVFPVEAFAGFVEGFTPQILENGYEVDYDTVERVENIRYDKFTFIARITGNSMYPHYKPGCKVLVVWVSDGNWQYTRGACVVSLKTGLAVFKRITRCENNLLYLESDNEAGGSMQVEIANINGIWKAMYKTYEPAE